MWSLYLNLRYPKFWTPKMNWEYVESPPVLSGEKLRKVGHGTQKNLSTQKSSK